MFWRAPTAALVVLLAAGVGALASTVPLTPDRSTTSEAVEGVPIAELTSESSTFAGKSVSVRAVVTADLRAPGSYGGFFIQAEEPAGIEGASDAIFVVPEGGAGDTTARGDLVDITGEVAELDGDAVLEAHEVVLVHPENKLPDVSPLPDSLSTADYEALAGMLVEPTGDYSLASLDALDSRGELALSVGARHDGVILIVDDGFSTEITTDARPYLLNETVVSVGDRYVAPQLPMVLSNLGDEYKLEPLEPVTASSDIEFLPQFEVAEPVLGDAPLQAP
jgi:5'-nucleotidase